MKKTQKNIQKFIKETRYEGFEINADGSRGTHYGNLDPMSALSWIAGLNALGHTAILCPKGTKLHGQIYPELGVMEASSFSMRDTDFVNKVKVYRAIMPGWGY